MEELVAANRVRHPVLDRKRRDVGPLRAPLESRAAAAAAREGGGGGAARAPRHAECNQSGAMGRPPKLLAPQV